MKHFHRPGECNPDSEDNAPDSHWSRVSVDMHGRTGHRNHSESFRNLKRADSLHIMTTRVRGHVVVFRLMMSPLQTDSE